MPARSLCAGCCGNRPIEGPPLHDRAVRRELHNHGRALQSGEKLTLNLVRGGTLTSIAYTTAATHCSSVLLHVLRHGHQIAQTKPLAAGASTDRLATQIHLNEGRTTLGFKAEGIVGGCNAGSLLSWGGRVTVSVRVG